MTGILLLVLLVIFTLAATFYVVFLGPPEHKPATPPATAPVAQKKKASAATPAKPAARPRPEPAPARIAIIIDDMGYHRAIGEALIELDTDLSFSFLPGAPFAAELRNKAVRRGRDILLHLPMQPEDPAWNPGSGALYVQMSPDTVRRTVIRDLALVPGAIGINNHMGSRYTRDPAAMTALLNVLRQRRLFFIDSVTSPATVGWSLARKYGVPTAKRSVFLDNIQTEKAINGQLATLLRLARKNGHAIGIGHPKKMTLQVLARFQVPADMELVGVHRLVAR